MAKYPMPTSLFLRNKEGKDRAEKAVPPSRPVKAKKGDAPPNKIDAE